MDVELGGGLLFQLEPRAVVLQRLGSDDEAVFEVEWAELDRSFDADHLTSVYIPELAEPVAAELARFDELVRVLRERCPWDREQTHASLRRHLLSEAHELLEALNARAAHPDLGPVADADDLDAVLFAAVQAAPLAPLRIPNRSCGPRPGASRSASAPPKPVLVLNCF